MNSTRPKQPETVYVGFPPPKQLETVAELDREFGSSPNKFKWIAEAYGYPPADPDDTNSVWSGPFFNAAGNVDIERVKKEIAEPGSVVPENFKSHNQLLREARHIESRRLQFAHTLETSERQQAAKEAEERLANRPEEDVRTDIESLLAEGVRIIPNLIDQSPGATVELVQKVASELGIEVFVNAACYAMQGPDPESLSVEAVQHRTFLEAQAAN